MLKSSRQQSFFSKTIRNVERMILHFQQHEDLEDLHDLRVELKKLHALIGLQKANQSGPEKSPVLDSIQTLFKEAGNIRADCIHLKLLKKYRIDKGNLQRKIAKRIKRNTKEFSCQTKSHLADLKQFQKRMFPLFKDLSNLSVKRKVKGELRSLKTVFRTDHFKHLHESRKTLKNLKYLKELLPKRLLNQLGISFSYIHSLESRIGDWHDLDRIVQLLKSKKHFHSSVILLKRKRKNAFSKIIKLTQNFNSHLFSEKSLNL